MGQDRTLSSRLDIILQGIRRSHRVGICGWKYLDINEGVAGSSGFFVSAVLVDCLKDLVDSPIVEATPVLLHPTKGLRACHEVEQAAALEWGAARASNAVINIMKRARPGMSELQAMSFMHYAGEPLSAHPMFSAGKEKIIGLLSPTARKIVTGDGVTTAVGYWGGLSCRAGLIDTGNDEFLNTLAKPYFKAIVTWYREATIGMTGGELFEKIITVLAEGWFEASVKPGPSRQHRRMDAYHNTAQQQREDCFRDGFSMRHHSHAATRRHRTELRRYCFVRRRKAAKPNKRKIPRHVGQN